MLPELKQKAVCDEAIALKWSIESSFLDLGNLLYRIKECGYYEPQWQEWGVFLEELKMSESQVSRLINIYLKFVVEYNFAPEQIVKAGGWTTVAKLLPVSTTKAKAEKYLQLASTLTRKDLDIELREERDGECDHKDDEVYILKVYSCGFRERIVL